MLIDGGGFYSKSFDTGENLIAPFLWKNKIKKIDYVVLSHAQRDHMGGLAFVVDRFSPKEFWWNGQGKLDSHLMEVLEKKKVQIKVLGAKSLSVNINEARIEFLNPLMSKEGQKEEDLNEASLVLRVVYGERALLFTGDIGVETEEKILLRSNVAADVLKVSHHGSLTSSSVGFLEAVDAEFAVFSVGWKNPFSFPRDEVLERFERRGAKVLRTDMHGAIILSTDGESLELRGNLTQ